MEKKPNYGKIIAITVCAVAGVCAVAFFLSKLLQKYFVLKDTEYDDLMEGEEADSGEIVVEHADEEEPEEAEEKAEDAEEEI